MKGQSTTLTVAFQPEGATDERATSAVSADKNKATVSVSGMTITVKGALPPVDTFRSYPVMVEPAVADQRHRQLIRRISDV
ncbi:Ig-like domain-containing protein [Escherichia coli]